jgi:transforming growth factor-beta-induced protein
MNKLSSRRRSMRVVGAVAVAVAGLGVAACGGDSRSGETAARTQPAETSTEAMQENIVETAVAAGDFTTLTSLLADTGLAESLTGEGPFTVFAPTDEAFANVPKKTLDSLAANPKKLKAVLLYHVVPGEARAADVARLTSAETLNGESVRLASSGGTVRVNDARVVVADVGASNGVIHAIDRVLIPSA